jgi:hypothetical protein
MHTTVPIQKLQKKNLDCQEVIMIETLSAPMGMENQPIDIYVVIHVA